MNELGVDFGFFLKFNNQLRSTTPEDFLEKILLRLNIKKLIIGYDFRFDPKRENIYEQSASLSGDTVIGSYSLGY